jgi:hypothetical protein
MKSILNFFSNNYFWLQSTIFLLMSLLNFHDFQKFWGFCIASVVSLGLSEILSELKKLNKNLESTTPKEKLL